MKYISRFALLFFSLTVILLSCGCKDDPMNSYIYVELPGLPSTVDAQTASSDAELLIVRNIYEGLLRKNESGSIVCGVAESFKKEGLTFTFRLRDDAFWSNGDRVTAHDFVFAFRRAVDPKTKAPFASRLLCIQNAAAINAGSAARETLGVSAENDTTLKITLSIDDPDFTEALTTSIAMPCNQEFFEECVGKYGLEARYVISNGSYSLTKWNKEDFGIRLYRNSEYKGNFTAKNAAAFLSLSKDETSLSLLKENKVDIGFIDCSVASQAEKSGLTAVSFENICWVMTVSKDYSPQIRKALAKLVSSESFANSLPDGYRIAESLFPKVYESGQAAAATGIEPYDLAGGKELLSQAILKLPDKKFPSTKLYYYDNGAIASPLKVLVGHWQQNLGAYINIEAASSPDLLISQLTEKSYQMAVFPVYTASDNLKEYLKLYGIDYTGQDLNSVQSSLTGDNTVIPLCFQETTICHTSALSHVYPYFSDGYIDFSFIIKTE